MLWVRYLCAGGLLGAAFTTNYRLVVYVATFVAVDFLVAWKRDGLRVAGTYTAAGMVGLAFLPLLWQMLGAVAATHGIILFRNEITYRPTSYVSEVLYQLHGGKQSALRFSPFPYLQWYIVRQGWPLSVLLLVGLGYAVRERSYRLLLPSVLVPVPYLTYTFAQFIVPRNLDEALPFTAILSASVLTPLTQWLQPHRIGRSPVHWSGTSRGMRPWSPITRWSAPRQWART